MKDSQDYILFKTIGLRHSPWIEDMDDPNKLQEGTHRSFIIKFNNNLDRISILIHFKHLSIHSLKLHYRKKSARNRKSKKLHPQHKMNLSFKNTLELLTYLSSKNYNVDWIEIRFKNGWAIKNAFLNELEFITNNTQDRNLLFDKLISLSGQGPIDINSLEINETYSLCTDGEVKLKPLFS
tara:strand:+ start:2618 stop:3160 length:543 start_codon:yes stop_codon:yes gene_type:complete